LASSDSSTSTASLTSTTTEEFCDPAQNPAQNCKFKSTAATTTIAVPLLSSSVPSNIDLSASTTSSAGTFSSAGSDSSASTDSIETTTIDCISVQNPAQNCKNKN